MIASEIINAAHGTSSKNNPGRTAATPEMLRVLNECFYGAYAIAARVNYLMFAVEEDIPKEAGGWPYPECAELVFEVRNPAEELVVLVPFNELDAEPGRPAIYFLGGFYNAAGNPNDPTDEVLTFYYSKVPRRFMNFDAAPDTTWRTRHDPLLIYDLGMYLARKDGRLDELPDLSRARDAALQRYVAWLEHANVMERRSYGPTRFAPSYSIQELSTLLVGGPSVPAPGAA